MKISRRIVVVAMLFVSAVGCGRGAQPTTEAALDDDAMTVPSPTATGLELYVTYCQGCHGSQGVGDGPVAPLLKVAPADLTRLEEKYGQFPEELVASTVDGRAEVESHGTREMPVWGNVWNDPNDPAAEDRVREQIQKLVSFLRTIQLRS